MRTRSSPGVALLMLAACGPTDPDAVRTAWLVDALYDENRVWMSRDPALLAEKYRVMAADPYDYVRGSVGAYLVDLARPGTGRAPTAFVVDPALASMLLVVDPHPENVGTLLPGEGPGPTPEALDWASPRPVPLVFEINDFDGAAFGAYLVDVRRAMLGLAVAIAPRCDRACRGPVLAAWAEGYADEIDDQDDGDPTFDPSPALGEQGLVLDRLLLDAIEEGAERERLDEWTEIVPGGRRFRAEATELAPLTLEEHAQVDRLLAQYDGPPSFRPLARARRYGGGVASLPAVRYVVAWDRGGDGPDDDELIEVREVVDPPVVPGLVAPPRTFDDQAARAVDAARLLWSRPDADARLAGLRDGETTFKVLTESSFHQAFDHRKLVADLDAGRFRTPDLVVWAEWLGRQLAAVHARSVTADGDPALPRLDDDVDDREQAFVAERVRDAEHDLAAALRDHRLFAAALDELGPWLGADRW